MRIVSTLVLFAGLSLAAQSPVAAQAPSAADAAAIAKNFREFEAAWAKADAKAVSERYATNGASVAMDGSVDVGRANIEKAMTSGFAGTFKGTAIIITPAANAARAIKPDVVLDNGTFELKKGTLSLANGFYTAVSVKTPKGWVISQSTVFVAPMLPPAVKK